MVGDLGPVYDAKDQVSAAVRALEAFRKELVPLAECPELLEYSHQYGRRLVLDTAVVDMDIFDVDGRWYVSRQFLIFLKGQAHRKGRPSEATEA